MEFGIFDDHTLINRGLSETIIKNFSKGTVAFTSTDRTHLFSELNKHQPDILIMDVVAPDVAGLELFEKINKDFPSVKIIAYTALTSPVLVENLLSMNVCGYVNKRQPDMAIIDAINTVMSGNIYVPDDYRYLVKKTDYSRESSFLSEREIEIMNLIAQEYTSTIIAEKLKISVNTVENHRKNIFQKLKVKNSAGLMMEATRLGYLS